MKTPMNIKMKKYAFIFITLILATGWISLSGFRKPEPVAPGVGEKHFKGLKQMTFGGENAEAYWSFDGQWLTFQHAGRGLLDARGQEPACDQIFRIHVDTGEVNPVSNGEGRTTCSYFFPDDSRILFASTHGSDSNCPPPPDMSLGYVWAIYPTYKLYSAKPDGSDLQPFEENPPDAYTAEATVCKDGSVVLTSDRSGDLELWVGRIDLRTNRVTGLRQITHELGYDGGAVFSPDCSKIVWRASRPKPGRETEEYLNLLKNHLVRPSTLDLYVANVNGENALRVTQMQVASFGPAFLPDGERLIFSSNFGDPRGREFDLFTVLGNGSGLERVTTLTGFDGFPLFSTDGKFLAFGSNRHNELPQETNVFVGEWTE